MVNLKTKNQSKKFYNKSYRLPLVIIFHVEEIRKCVVIPKCNFFLHGVIQLTVKLTVTVAHSSLTPLPTCRVCESACIHLFKIYKCDGACRRCRAPQ